MNRSDIRAWIAGSGNLLTDVIFPVRCPVCGQILPIRSQRIHPACRKLLTFAGESVCIRCGKILEADGRSFCRDCEERERAFVQGRSVWLHDRYMSRSLYEFKYANAREYADFYAEELNRLYAGTLRKWEITVLVPVPTHRKRKQKRGYNQAELLAVRLSRLSGIPVHTELLSRIRETGAQKNLSRTARRYNLKGAFSCPGKMRPGERICLIDDIYTTGATVEECAGVLREAGADRVYFLTVTTGSE